jgi:hypothetical protein
VIELFLFFVVILLAALVLLVGHWMDLERQERKANRLSSWSGPFTEEWHVESVGGGTTGTRDEIEKWVEEWHAEYGDRYSIHVQRRVVSEWEPCEP